MPRDGELPPGTTTERDPVTLDPGTVIDGRYRLVELIGEGGMGQVFEAEHKDLRRKVAIKMLAAQGRLDEQMVKRFEREAHTLAAVSHPNVVTVTDYGIHEGLPFLVMERLEGKSLAALLEERRALTLEHAGALMRQILAGLGHAHARGLVHRDLKPGNVWVEAHEDGEHVKLLDFGFAKFVTPEGGTLLTADGIVVGTLAYMSPEQASGGAIDPRSDIYSAGVLLFEMLTGRRPFEGEPIDILRAHLTAEPPSLAAARPGRTFPPEVEAVVRRALEKKPADRFETAPALAKALQAAIAREPSAETETLVYEPPPGEVDSGAKTVLREEPATHVYPRISPARPMPPPSEIALRTQDLEPIARKAGVPRKKPRSRRRPGVLVAAVAVGAVAIGIGVVLRYAPWPFGGRDEPPVPDLVVALDEAAAAADPPAQGDAWTLYPRDRVLERHRAHVRRGESFPRETLRELRAYERAHPEDPRVELLIARAFLNDRWFSDALDRFAQAHAKDARIAGSEDFLTGVVQLVRYEATTARASAMVESIYGAQAVPTVERALADAANDRAARARLETLLRRLQS